MISKRLAPFGITIFSEMTKLAEEKGAINLAQGFPDFDGPAEILEAAVKAIHDGYNQYPRSMGNPALVEAIAKKVYRDYGLNYDPLNEVVVFSGATEGISSSFLALLNPGDEVILFEPFYESYPVCASLAGAIPRYCTLRFPDFNLDRTELEGCFTRRTRLLLLNTPHNPTGKVFSIDELETIAELCIKHNVIVITDEVYEHITYDGVKHIPIATIPGMRERTICISSIGKTFSLTGWRIGWGVGPSALISAVQRAHQHLTFAAPGPLQAGIASILDQYSADYYKSLQADYTARRDLLLDALNKAGFRTATPKGTYYILADFTSFWEGDDRSFVHHLIEQCSIAAIPPSVFYAKKPEEGKCLVRFAFCKKLSTLKKASEQLKQLK
jgi:N-succinyldiaminopimelate aminotransferase